VSILIKLVAIDAEEFGADGITVHPRPDERHIRYNDIPILKECVKTEFNIEGYPNDKFIQMVLENKPHQVTLVPDPPGVLTSSEGWDVVTHKSFLTETIQLFKDQGIRVSIFLEANPDTGDYANFYETNREEGIKPHILASKAAQNENLGLNAGHDLNLDNLRYYAAEVIDLQEVSIGHALISDALYYGLQNTIGMYKRLLQPIR